MQDLDRDEVVCGNLGLVHACCRRFRGRGIDYDDLFQAGCIGLLKAADGFERSRGLCFSTYAVPAILGEIKRMFRDGGTIKVSRSLRELSLRVRAETERELKEHDREPTPAELAKRLSVTPEEITEALCATQTPLSLTYDSGDEVRELELSDGGDGVLNDKLLLREAVSRLPEPERKIIALRYFEGKTQSETAKLLGMTQVRVSRAEKRILSALRGMMGE